MKIFRVLCCALVSVTFAALPLDGMNNVLSLKKKARKRVLSLLRSNVADTPQPVSIETKQHKFPIPKNLLHLHRHFITEFGIPAEVSLIIIKDFMRLVGQDWIYAALLEAVQKHQNDLYELTQSLEMFCDSYGIDTCAVLLKKCLQELGLTLYDLRGKTFGSTLLHYAARGNYKGVVKLLFNVMGNDAYAFACVPALKGGTTPLHVAAIVGRAKIAGLLLAAAPSRDAVLDMVNRADEAGKSPFDIALEVGKGEMIHLLNVYRDKNISDDELNELLAGFNNNCKI